MKRNEKMEKKILWLSFGAGVLFVISEFSMAIYTGSQSVLMDAAYDASELLMIGLTLFLMPLFHRPISEKYPFGYSQVESILVIIKGFMILSVTLGLSANSIEIALSGGSHIDAGQISVFQLLIALASSLILLLMMRMNRSISSPIVTAEVYGWKIDVAYSLGMSVAFFSSTFFNGTKLEFLSPYFDQIVAVLIILFMLPEAMKMLFRAIKDAFLFSPEQETLDDIKETCNSILTENGLEVAFYEVTRTGRRLWVAIYFKVSGDYLEINSLYTATQQANTALAEKYDNCVCELIVTTPMPGN
jgi:predicted Co/Zn/Cd cation transporter (cation efflux family)